MTDITIIGDAPGPNTDPTDPLFPHTSTGAAARLIELMGISENKYLRVTRRLNANHDGENALDPAMAATRMAGALAGANSKLIIVVGRAAANLHRDTKDLDFGDVIEYHGRRLVVIPHTSGRNRYWNDKGNKARIGLILRQELQRIGEENARQLKTGDEDTDSG